MIWRKSSGSSGGNADTGWQQSTEEAKNQRAQKEPGCSITDKGPREIQLRTLPCWFVPLISSYQSVKHFADGCKAATHHGSSMHEMPDSCLAPCWGCFQGHNNCFGNHHQHHAQQTNLHSSLKKHSSNFFFLKMQKYRLFPTFFTQRFPVLYSGNGQERQQQITVQLIAPQHFQKHEQGGLCVEPAKLIMLLAWQ